MATSYATATTMASLWQCPTIKSLSKSQPNMIIHNRLTDKQLTEASSSSSSSVSSVSWKSSVMGTMAAAAVMMGCATDADATRIEYYATVSEPSCEMNYVGSGLGYCDLVVGSGPQAPYNNLINIHYTARFADETVFDSSYKRGRPLIMRIGVGKVIKGLDQGIFGGNGVPPMQVGGKRKLRIPPELAYGPEPAGCFSGDCNIPANATLLYDINFVGVYEGNRKE